MSLRSSEAILLDVYDLHEYDQIVTLLTREAGKRRGVAKGSRRRFSRFSGQLRPLHKVRATWFEKEGRELVRISSLETVRAADSLGEDLEGILIAACLAEHMAEFAQESEEDDLLYRLLDSTIGALLEGVDRSLAMRYYEAWVLRLSGVFPVPSECPGCGGALLQRGAMLAAGDDAILCPSCAGAGTEISSEAVDFLLRISRSSLMTLSTSPPSAAALGECEAICGRVRRAFLQHELKSYRVMRETLAGLADKAVR
jgi:DNA repair protein RecO (recombination protein O)